MRLHPCAPGHLLGFADIALTNNSIGGARSLGGNVRGMRKFCFKRCSAPAAPQCDDLAHDAQSNFFRPGCAKIKARSAQTRSTFSAETPSASR